MSDVAAAAGVSRQTLYNEFGSPARAGRGLRRPRDRDAGRQVADAVRAHADDAHAALRAAFALFLQLASDEPVVQILIVADAEDGRADTGCSPTLGQHAGRRHDRHPDPRGVAAGRGRRRPPAGRVAGAAGDQPRAGAGVGSGRVADDIGRMFAPFVDEVLASP